MPSPRKPVYYHSIEEPPMLCPCGNLLMSEDSRENGICGMCFRKMRERVLITVKRHVVRKTTKHPWGFEKI